MTTNIHSKEKCPTVSDNRDSINRSKVEEIKLSLCYDDYIIEN